RARLRSTLIWALAMPGMVVGVAGIGALAAGPLAAIAGLALLPLAWGAQMLRIARGRRRDFGDPPRLALLYGLFTMLAKPAELLGALRYWRHRQRGGKAQIIEYKTPAR
ncbi:MAG: glycosyltransferase family 2 protein, partial [Pseudomonadota bacterium]